MLQVGSRRLQVRRGQRSDEEGGERARVERESTSIANCQGLLELTVNSNTLHSHFHVTSSLPASSPPASPSPRKAFSLKSMSPRPQVAAFRSYRSSRGNTRSAGVPAEDEWAQQTTMMTPETVAEPSAGHEGQWSSRPRSSRGLTGYHYLSRHVTPIVALKIRHRSLRTRARLTELPSSRRS